MLHTIGLKDTIFQDAREAGLFKLSAYYHYFSDRGIGTSMTGFIILTPEILFYYGCLWFIGTHLMLNSFHIILLSYDMHIYG